MAVGSVLVVIVLVMIADEEEVALCFLNLFSFFCTLISVISLDIR